MRNHMAAFLLFFFANIDKQIKMCYTYLSDGIQVVYFRLYLISIVRLAFCRAIMFNINGHFSTPWCRELPKMPKLLKVPKVYRVVSY